jgi:hypothetical protein
MPHLNCFETVPTPVSERSLSDGSRKSVLIERYPPSKYATAFAGGSVVGAGGDLFISPPSNYSGSSLSDQQESSHYHGHHHHHSSSNNHLARSLSMPGQESEGGHTSYTSCSVHGTLRYRRVVHQWDPLEEKV